ncbi:MAG: Trm112 family protein [Gammaproteobacteria bacterium]|nr:Trm112 family protein [Gammaproteobacteria bacterium]
MSFDTALLDIVCCPVTRLPLQVMPSNRAERLNAMIGEHRIRNRDGQVVDGTAEQWLMTRDGKLAYPVRDGIPVLIDDHGVELAQLAD